MSKAQFKTGGRYPVLRTMGILSLFGALAVVGVGIYGVWWALAKSLASTPERIGLAAVILAGTYFVVIMVLALAELIKLMIDVEHNTRVAAMKSSDPPVDEEESAEAALIRGH